FREAFEADPEGVSKLFTLTTQDEDDKEVRHGFAARLDAVIDAITQTGTGLLSRQADATQDKIDAYNRRASDMERLLDLKEARLSAQFQARQRALASLQTQQSALASLAALVASFTSAGGGLSLA